MEKLEADLRGQELITFDFAVAKDNPFGRRFEIRAPLATSNDLVVMFQSICQIEHWNGRTADDYHVSEAMLCRSSLSLT